jgi:mutator protein MutT
MAIGDANNPLDRDRRSRGAPPSKPIHEIALALVQRDERWLVAKRERSAHLGELWEFPGGKQLAHEAPTDAAVRELYEECGVRARAERTLDVVVYEYADRIVRLTPVMCQWEAGEPRPRASEHCGWVTGEELQRLEMPPANAAIVRAIVAG